MHGRTWRICSTPWGPEAFAAAGQQAGMRLGPPVEHIVGDGDGDGDGDGEGGCKC
jgi:hypothetical protein